VKSQSRRVWQKPQIKSHQDAAVVVVPICQCCCCCCCCLCKWLLLSAASSDFQKAKKYFWPIF